MILVFTFTNGTRLVPHLKAEHMAAPTKAANVKKALANSEPSTHGTKRTIAAPLQFVRYWARADIDCRCRRPTNHLIGFQRDRREAVFLFVLIRCR